MANKKKNQKKISFDGMEWGERELAQIVRRKMISKGEKNKKKYSRKSKHKNPSKDGVYFFSSSMRSKSKENRDYKRERF